MENEEVMFQAQLLQEEAQKVQQQLDAVEQQLNELTQYKLHLHTFEKSTEKELLSSLGKGIYAKTSLVSKDLFLEVGAGVVVKKTPKEVVLVIEDQIKKLSQMRGHLLGQQEICEKAMRDLIEEVQRQQHKTPEQKK